MYLNSIDENKKSAIIRIAILGIFSFIAIAFLTIKSVIPSIEKDLLHKVSLVLYENKLNNIIVSVSGQDIFLEGLVTNKVQSKAIQVVSQVRGVENVYSEFILISPIAKTGSTK